MYGSHSLIFRIFAAEFQSPLNQGGLNQVGWSEAGFMDDYYGALPGAGTKYLVEKETLCMDLVLVGLSVGCS